MPLHPMRIFGDPILRARCSEVTRFDAGLQRFANDLEVAMDHYRGVGVAANQLGLDQRIFVYDDEGVVKWMCNPVLSDPEGEVRMDEGCLSVPGLYFETARAEAVTVTSVGIDGVPMSFRAEGFLARIMQHETDHLNGLLYLDRLDEDLRRQAMREIRERDIRPEA